MRHKGEHTQVLKISTAVLITLLALLANHGVAQDVANGQATANVLEGLTVTAVQDLQFGDMLQGVAKSVGRDDDVNSGIFSVTGNAGSGIDIYLTLPAYMALADGSDRLNIAFSTTDAAVDENNLTPSTVVDIVNKIPVDPHNMPAGLVLGALPLPGTTRVYIGGRATPSIDQKAGAYAGDIICSVAYNGT